MLTHLRTMAALVRDLLRSHLSMQIEILALRHQLGVYQRVAKHPPIRPADRVLWVWLSRRWSRRRVLHFNVTANPTAAWTAQQIVEAFPDQDPPQYLLRDRDGIYGHAFRKRVAGLGAKEVLTAARSPWQNPFVERRSAARHAAVSSLPGDERPTSRPTT